MKKPSKWMSLAQFHVSRRRDFRLEPQDIVAPESLRRLGAYLQTHFPRQVVGYELRGGLSRSGPGQPKSFVPFDLHLVTARDELDAFVLGLLEDPDDVAIPDFFDGRLYSVGDQTAYRFGGQFHHDPGEHPAGAIEQVCALSGPIGWQRVNDALEGFTYFDVGDDKIRVQQGGEPDAEIDLSPGPPLSLRPAELMLHDGKTVAMRLSEGVDDILILLGRGLL